MRGGITNEQILQAADELEANKKSVTVRAVKKKTGGATDKVTDVVREWKLKKGMAVREPSRKPAPEWALLVIASLKQQLADALSYASDLEGENTDQRSANATLKQKIECLEDEIHDYLQQILKMRRSNTPSPPAIPDNL